MAEVKTLTINGKTYTVNDPDAANIDDTITSPDKTWSSKKISEEISNSGGGTADGAVLYTPQTLTPEQQAQARENIMAAGKEEIEMAYNAGIYDAGYEAGAASVDPMFFARGIADGTITEYIDAETTFIKYHTFIDCRYMKAAVIPNVTVIDSQAFADASALEKVDSSKLEKIWDKAFRDCNSLKAFILRNTNGVCELYDDGFSDTPIAYGEEGYIYVPRALVDTYKAETNWSRYGDQFRALEDYTVDGTTTGALDESKI